MIFSDVDKASQPGRTGRAKRKKKKRKRDRQRERETDRDRQRERERERERTHFSAYACIFPVQFL